MAPDNPHLVTGEVNLHDPAFAACPHAVFAALRASFPVSRASDPEGGQAVTVVLSRYEDVVHALEDWETFSSDIGQSGPLSPAPVHVDPPEHTRFRDLLKPHFSRQRIERHVPFVRSEVHRLIDAFAATGACDYQKDFAVPLPSSVLLRIMGLPASDLDLLLAFKNDIIHPQTADGALAETRRDGALRALAYLGKVLDERLVEPADDLLSDLIRTGSESDVRFTAQELLRVCLNLLLGGLDTITASLGCSMAYLARNSDQRRHLTQPGHAVARAARELLRIEAPVTAVPRLARRDTTIAGVNIQAGTLVMLLLGSASADERAFPDAARVDFDRHPNGSLAFGFGRHRCIGEYLGQMVLEVGLEEWHRRIPDYWLNEDEPLVYSAVVRAPERLPLEWDVAAIQGRAD